MNKIDKNPDYKKLYSIVYDKFKRSRHFYHGPFDETFFTLRVYESAKYIIKKLKKRVNMPQILVATILHDIGKTRLKIQKIFGENKILRDAPKEWNMHAKLSVLLARDILKNLGHSKKFISEVCCLIENHDLRGDKVKVKSLELKILQDADLIADCGYAGFIRPFLFCGKFSHYNIISSIKYLKGVTNRVVEDKMLNLKISKTISVKEIKLEKKLINEISKYIKSDLLNVRV